MPKTIFNNRDRCYMVLVNGNWLKLNGILLPKEGKVTLAVSFCFLFLFSLFSFKMVMILISSGVSVDGYFQPWLHCCEICTDSREPRGFENNWNFLLVEVDG